jgi:hypothetical protein
MDGCSIRAGMIGSDDEVYFHPNGSMAGFVKSIRVDLIPSYAGVGSLGPGAKLRVYSGPGAEAIFTGGVWSLDKAGTIGSILFSGNNHPGTFSPFPCCCGVPSAWSTTSSSPVFSLSAWS